MSDARNSLIPAGWYPDPHGLPQQRWWSGTQWTGTVAPLQTRGPSLLSSLPGPTINAAPQTTLPATATDPSRFPSRRQLRAVTEDAPQASEQQAAAEARAEEEHRAEEAHRFEQHRQEQKRLEQLHLEQYRAEQSKLYEQHRLEMERLEEKFREEEARLTNEHLNLGSDHLAPVTQLSTAAAAPVIENSPSEHAPAEYREHTHQQNAHPGSQAPSHPDVAYPAASAENPAPQFAAFAPKDFSQETAPAVSSFAPPAATEQPRAVPELALTSAGSASGTISPAALSAASMPIVSMPVHNAPAQNAAVQDATVQNAAVQNAPAQAAAVSAPVSAASTLSATPARVSPMQGHATSPVSASVPAAAAAATPEAAAETAIPGWHPAPSSLNPNPKPLFAPQTAKGAAAVATQPATTRIPTMSTSTTSESSLVGASSPFSGLGPSRTGTSAKATPVIEDKPAYQPFGMVSRTTTGAVSRPERVDTLSLWVIVALPLIMVATLAAVATQLTEFYTLFMEGGVLFIFALLTLVFAARDQRQLIDSGHLKTASPAWMLLTPLAYLIARTVEVKRQSGRMSFALWVWLGVIAIIGAAGALFPELVTQIVVASSLI